jgi:hypothetical protein
MGDELASIVDGAAADDIGAAEVPTSAAPPTFHPTMGAELASILDEAAAAAPPATGAAFEKPEGWLPFELGTFSGREQLKACAPIGTTLDEPAEGMIMGKDGDDNVVFVVSMAQAAGEEEGENAGVDATALEAAVADFVDTYDAVSNVHRELLADGYVFTARNEPEIGGTNYWVFCRRFFPSKGKAWNVEATAASAEQQASAVAFAKSIHDVPGEC